MNLAGGVWPEGVRPKGARPGGARPGGARSKDIWPKGIRRKGLRFLTAVLFVAVSLFFMGCRDNGGIEHKNMPYEPDTPVPAPHEGVFVSEHGTMTFAGDGEHVTIDFDEALSECLGLPAGEQEAAYVFLSGNLPPHGYVPVRYDVAHMIGISVGEGKDAAFARIEIGVYQDGSFHTGTNCTTEDRITFFVDWKDDGDWEAVDFLKQP